jgi:hypothetical protein
VVVCMGVGFINSGLVGGVVMDYHSVFLGPSTALLEHDK